MDGNPFKTPRETRSITLTLRVTPSEHKALEDRARTEGVEIVELIREGLGLALDRPPKKERRR